MVKPSFKSLKLKLCLYQVLVWVALFNSFSFTDTALAQGACSVTLNSGESISDAISAATAGDIICLNAGTYSGGFIIDKDDITLIGIDTAEKSVITGNGSYLIRIQNSINTRIENLELQSSANFAVYGIGISSSPVEGIELHDNIITGNNSGEGVLMSNYTGNWTFTENTFEDHSTGIRFQGDDNVVSDNTFTNNVLDIEFTSAGSSTITNNLLSNGILFSSSDFNHNITGNTFSNGDILYFSTSEDNPTIPSTARQIIVTNATNLEITGFILSNSALPIQVSHSAGAQIHNNEIRDLQENTISNLSSGAIKVSSSPNSIIYENLIQNNDMRAIYVAASESAIIRDNELQSNLEGILVRNALNVIVDSNNISDTYNPDNGRGHGVSAASTENLEILNNTITDSDGYGIHDTNVTSNKDVIIKGNTITGSKSNAIDWTDSQDAVIDLNTITDNAGGIRGPFNGIIKNNTITNSGLGIDARNNTLVEGNDIRNGVSGIEASFSVEVVDNIIIEHEATGINMGQGNGQVVSNNQMSGNSVDIRLSGNENVTVTDNDLETGIVLYSFYGEFEEYDHIITGNTVGGKPLVYINGENNPVIPSNAGQIIIFNSTDVTISDFTFSNVASPVSLLHSPGAVLNNLTIEGAGPTTAHNSALIEIVYSENSTVENNNLSNGRRGVGIYRSETVTVNENLINRSRDISNFYGIYTRLSPSIIITNNEINANEGTRGIEIDGTGHHSIIKNNEISNTSADAIVVSIADSIKVEENTITDGNGRGLYLSRAVDASIINNTITGHASHGIDTNFGSNLSDSPYLEGNIISNNSGTGIRLQVNELEMRDNTIEGNEVGAEINEYFVVEDNIFRNNTLEGLKIPDAVPDSYISQNIIEGNGSGIAFSGGGTLIAGNNWWGDSSGPSGGVYDPVTETVANGSGDSVSSNVNFDPWFTTEPTESSEPIGETEFEYASFSVITDSIITGNTATATVWVTNTGDSLNYYQVDLKLNDEIVQSKSELLGAGDSENVKIQVQISEPGTYQLSVNDFDAEEVVVTSGWPNKNFGVDNNASAEFLYGPKTEQLVMDWQSVESSTVSSRPVVVDGIIYYGMFNNHFYAADAETGEIIWETDTGATIRSSASIKDDFVVSGNSDGEIFALNRNDGEYIWNRELGSNLYSSPVIINDVVYISIFNDQGKSFQALDLNTGSELWVYDIGESSSSTPAVVDDVIYVGSNDGNLYALNTSENTDPEDRLKWKYETSNSFGNSNPIVKNDFIYFKSGNISSGNTLYVVEEETGELSWSKSISGSSTSNPVISDGVIYIGSSSGNFYALDIENGDEIWSFEPTVSFGSITFNNSDPVVADGIVYVISGSNVNTNRHLYGLDVETGNVIVDYEGTGIISGGPTVIDGRAYAGISNGGLRAFRETIPEDYIADPELTTVTATSSHWADGSDNSIVDIIVRNEFDNPIDDLQPEDFEVTFSDEAEASDAVPYLSNGRYRFEVSSNTSQTLNVTVSVKEVTLNDQPEIEFLSTESNWSEVNIDIFKPDLDVAAVHFANEEEGWLLASLYGDGVRANETQILKTEDGGETWTEQYYSDDLVMMDLFFINDQKGWVTGFSNFVLHTSDGGESWIEQSVNEIESDQDFRAIHFSDENNGWIAGNELFYKTENGGENWSAQNLSRYVRINDIHFTDNETGWLGASANPGIFKTIDGGNNLVPGADTSGISSLTFLNDQTGYAVGGNGLILSTVDSGDNWELLSSGTSENLNAVSFNDEKNGWIVGWSGTILTTSDGGNSWAHEYPGTSDNILFGDVQFISPEIGWATGRFGSVFKYDASTSEPEPDPIVDATISSVTTTTPHIADGEDASLVTITLLDTEGDTLKGLPSSDFSRSLSGPAIIGDLAETETSGVYAFKVQSTEAGTVTVTITAQEIELDDKPTIIFEEPEDEPIDPVVTVDADSSSVTTSSPHIADGNDEATILISLRTAEGQQIGGFESDKFEVTLNDENAAAGSVTETGSSGEYSFTVTSVSPGEIQVTVVADEVTLSDQPVILFEPDAEPIPPSPVFVSISGDETGLTLNWSMDSEDFIAGYKIYSGSSLSQLTEYNTVAVGTQSLAILEVPQGATFYAISAINNDKVEGERSNILSYVNENVVANTSWQLSSIPLGSATVASEMATIFGYSNSYITTETLEHSKGYWIKTKTFDTEIIPASGVGLDSTSVVLNKGWNLIGSLSDTISVSAIKDRDEILTSAPVFRFSNNQYQETRQIIPNSGHWIFASDSGRVNLSIYSDEPDPTKGDPTSKVAEWIDDGPKITFTSGEESSEIIVSNEFLSTEERHRFMLPPVSPGPILDIRTTDHTRLMNNEPTRLELRSVNFPVHIEVEGVEENFEYAYRLTVEKEGELRAIDLVPGQPNILSEEYETISLEKIHVDELITEHKIMPNYPNPFNPTTTIHYQVREQSDVRIEVFDVIGRRVQILADGNQFSGEYRVNFDARNLASGVYIIRFIAGNYMDIQKMTLIK